MKNEKRLGRMLAEFYSGTSQSVFVEHPEYETASELHDEIERQSQTEGHEKSSTQFLTKVFAIAVVNFVNDYPEPEPVTDGLDNILDHVIGMSNSSNHNHQPDSVISDVYASIFVEIAENYPEPDTDCIQSWLDEIESRAITTAQSSEHSATPVDLLENIYSTTIFKLMVSQPNPAVKQAQAWLTEFERRISIMANSNAHQVSPSQFLTNIYAIIIINLSEKYPDPENEQIQDWLNEIYYRAQQMAIDDIHDSPPSQFLGNIYSMAVSTFAERHSEPSDIEPWLSTLMQNLPKLPVSKNESTTDISLTPTVASMSLSRIQSDSEIDLPTEWSRATLSHALDAVDDEDLDEFSSDFQRMYHISCAQAEALPEALPLFLLELRARTVESDDPILTDRDARLDLLSNALADAVFGMWTFGDQNLESDPGKYAPQAVGAGAPDDLEFVVDTLARTDERLAAHDVSDWLLEHADDRPGDPLRDRTLAFGYAAAASTLDDSDDVDQSVETLAEAAAFADERDPTTRLYRGGLQAIRDGNRDEAKRLLELAWLRRDRHDSGTTAHGHAIAAGVGYAAHLALEDDPDPSPESVLAEVESADVMLSDATTALVEATREDELTVDPDDLTEDVDVEDDPHDVDDLESLAYSSLISLLVNPPGPAEYYRAGLEAVAQSNPETAIQTLHTAWEGRDEADDSTRRAVVAAGVGLLAHVDMGMVDSGAIGREELAEGVESTRDELLPAILAVFEYLTDGETTHTPDELRADVDDDDDFERDDLETAVFARLLELLTPDDDQPVREENGESEPPGEPETTGSSPEDEPDPTISDIYTAALYAVTQNEVEDAINFFATAWGRRDEAEGEEQRDGVAAGVALLAHVEMDWLDSEVIDREILTTAVAEHRDQLSEAVTVLFDACTGDSPDIDPDELRGDVDPEAEEFDRDDLERLVLAGLLDHLGESDGESTGDATSSDQRDETSEHSVEATPDEDDDSDVDEDLSELRGLYEAGLCHTMDGDRQAAIGPLMDAWDYHDSVGDDGKRMAFGAGLALAVHVADDSTLSMIREAIFEVVAEQDGYLSEPVYVVFEATNGEDSDTTPADLRGQAADTDGLDALEARAFARLLERHQS